MIKTRIVKVKGDWKEILDDCRFTVNKKPIDKEPSDAFKKSILIAEHTPIRDFIIKWEWLSIPHWVTVHWVRHKFEKFVGTQRTDRTGVDRTKLPQDEPQNMRGEANVQHLIDSMRRRLCSRASKETRDCAYSLKIEIHDVVDENIANVLVPNCVYRGGCPEYDKKDDNRCKFYEKFEKMAKESNVDISDIKSRYDYYNKKFYSGVKK